MAGTRMLVLSMLGLVLVLATWGIGGEPLPQEARDETTLREAKLKVDDASLLAFFRERTLRPEQRARLAAWLRQLGDDSFAIREQATQELIKAGRSALPVLRSATRDRDVEIARRVEYCLQAIEQRSELELTLAATRLLTARRPAGAVEVLLAYQVAQDDEVIEEAVLAALLRLGLTDGKPDPILLRALVDPEPRARAVAVHVMGRARAEERQRARERLADEDARVRCRAAMALVRAGEKQAVPALAAALEEAPLSLAVQAESLLWLIAREQTPRVALGNGGAAGRKACRQTWEAWWKTHAERIDLAKLDLEGGELGLIIICDCDVPAQAVGRVWECRTDGKPIWQVEELRNPCDVQVLPGGRFLVAECQSNLVTERDRQGKILWQHRTASHPTSCQRLPDGNTFITTYNEVLEVTPDGKVIYSHKRSNGTIYCAQKLRTGNIVIAEGSGSISELTTEGKVVRQVGVEGLAAWAGVEVQPNGRFLVAHYSANRVSEIDDNGKVYWECSVNSPTWATRLRNGHTLVASCEQRCLIEFDRAGKEVWKQATQGRPFRARRY